ncbi:MAG: hypothetical protein AAGP08_04750 [Pseudomonadota bacterium]
MTNTLAILFAAVILAAVAADVFYYDGAYLLFLGRKFLDLLTWVAFWR